MGAAGNTGIRLTCSTIGLCLCVCGEASEDAERRLVSPGRAACAGAAGESAGVPGTWSRRGENSPFCRAALGNHCLGKMAEAFHMRNEFLVTK